MKVIALMVVFLKPFKQAEGKFSSIHEQKEEK